MLADFHEQDNLPVDRDDLNISARGVANLDASMQALLMHVDGPVWSVWSG